MGRQFFTLTISFLAVMALAGALRGQSQPTPHFRVRALGPGNGPVNPGRERFYQLSPEERQAFRRNAERWLQMNPAQQKLLRERELARRQQLRSEAEEAMRASGLRLDPKTQGLFEARYVQERRKLERTLRQETEAKRQQELPQLNARLKSEFQSHQNNAAEGAVSPPTVSPSVSARPNE